MRTVEAIDEVAKKAIAAPKGKVSGDFHDLRGTMVLARYVVRSIESGHGKIQRAVKDQGGDVIGAQTVKVKDLSDPKEIGATTKKALGVLVNSYEQGKSTTKTASSEIRTARKNTRVYKSPFENQNIGVSEVKEESPISQYLSAVEENSVVVEMPKDNGISEKDQEMFGCRGKILSPEEVDDINGILAEKWEIN